MFLQRIAAIGSKAQAECFNGAAGQPTIAKISTGPRTGCRLQLVLKEQRRHFHDVLQRGALALAAFRLHIRLRHRHASHIGNLLHGFGKTHAIEISQEPEMIAGDTATEAMVAPLAVLAMEAWALFTVERAACPIITLGGVALLPVPRHTSADNIRDVHSVTYLVEK